VNHFPGSEQKINYLRTSAGKDRERPNRMLETMVPKRPNKSTGLRPTWSERRLHWSTVTASAAKYRDTCEYRRGAERRRADETYNKACIVSDFPFVTTNDWELTNKLRRIWVVTYVRGDDERT